MPTKRTTAKKAAPRKAAAGQNAADVVVIDFNLRKQKKYPTQLPFLGTDRAWTLVRPNQVEMNAIEEKMVLAMRLADAMAADPDGDHDVDMEDVIAANLTLINTVKAYFAEDERDDFVAALLEAVKGHDFEAEDFGNLTSVLSGRVMGDLPTGP
jgi:hypothetical protein